ncbi:hypothetical protein Tco_0798778 [Tanacetum coccineum]
MRRDLAVRLRMMYTGGDRQQFLSTCRMSDTEMGLDVADTLCFQLGDDMETTLFWHWDYTLSKRWQRLGLDHIRMIAYQRRVRPKTSDASTSAAPHTDDQPDP